MLAFPDRVRDRCADVPVHTWLPDAHVEVPRSSWPRSALKVGGAGFIRFAADHAGRLAGVRVGRHRDVADRDRLHRLRRAGAGGHEIADRVPSIAHMAFVTAGLFIALALCTHGNLPRPLAVQGAMVQMTSHGFVSGAMFSCIGVLYDRQYETDRRLRRRRRGSPRSWCCSRYTRPA